MTKIVIVANGRASQAINIPQADHIIAADNGAAYCLQAGITPDLLIGDFDSVSAENLQKLNELNIPKKTYPEEKDQTDLEIALLHAVTELSAKKIIIINATGARDDMSLANILLLTHPSLQDCDIELIGEQQIIKAVSPKKPFSQTLKPGTVFSLLPLSTSVHGVNTTGLKYPIIDDTLHRGMTRSISNEVIEPTVTIEVDSGWLLVTYYL